MSIERGFRGVIRCGVRYGPARGSRLGHLVGLGAGVREAGVGRVFGGGAPKTRVTLRLVPWLRLRGCGRSGVAAELRRGPALEP